MHRLQNFALRRPFLFGLALIFVYTLLTTLAYPVHYLFPETETGVLYGDAVSKLLVCLVFLGLLWRFGWLRASGITRLGDGRLWLVVAVIALYKVLAELYAFTGDFALALPTSPLGIANTFYALTTSLVEETMYRALVLVAMISAWGATRRGQIKAVLLSSLFFGLMHLFNLILRPFGVVFFQAIVLTLPGILYAALVLTGRSLWPAILIHWLTNAAVNIKLIGVDTYQETLSMWGTFALFLIPLVLYSAYLVWKLPQPYPLDLQSQAQPVDQ